MPEPMDVRNVMGVRCEMVMPECWAFKLAGPAVWHYELWGRRLRISNVLVTEGVKTLQLAVAIATGFELGVAESQRLARQELNRRAKLDGKSGKELPFPKLDRGEEG